MRIYSYVSETVNSLDDAVENSVGFLNRQTYLLLLCSLCFLVPFALGEPQLVVGTIVNAALVAGAFKLRGWELLPLVTLPSLGALSRGLVFGPWTPYLALMIPFIWLGNAALVFAVKRFAVLEKKGFAFGNAAGIAAKVALIFGAACALYSLGALPIVFLAAMGILQLVTALAGSALAFGFLKAEARLARFARLA
ncbi:MAG: hypothetical protein V1817_03670 [Candidatus Micrarchaeota archaeon]